jgi:hypothetical protein
MKVIGDFISPPAENSLMILSVTDLEHLLLLYTSGAQAPEILRIAKCKSNGQVRSYHEMKRLTENVFGTTETSVQLSSSSLKAILERVNNYND